MLNFEKGKEKTRTNECDDFSKIMPKIENIFEK